MHESKKRREKIGKGEKDTFAFLAKATPRAHISCRPFNGSRRNCDAKPHIHLHTYTFSFNYNRQLVRVEAKRVGNEEKKSRITYGVMHMHTTLAKLYPSRRIERYTNPVLGIVKKGE